MEPDEAPPPYSAVDPLLAQTNNGRDVTVATDLRLRGGNAPTPVVVSPTDSSSASGLNESISASRVSSQTNLTSAATYFEERPPTVFEEGRDILRHHLNIYPRSQAKDFPRRPRCWGSRTGEITQHDWDAFLKFLFPPHLGFAASSEHLPRHLRAQIQRDRKDRPQETDEQRQVRIAEVVSEWNQCFFEPRATRLVLVYVTDSGSAPSSPLCPNCYPAATNASNRSGPSGSAELPGRQQPTRSNVPSAVSDQPATSQGNNTLNSNAPFSEPLVTTALARPSFYPPVGPFGTHFPPLPPPGPYSQHWPAQPWPSLPHGLGRGSPCAQSPGFRPFKGGPLNWITQFASQVQNYGERISEQAQRYGDQFAAQAENYGNRALAGGHWIEEQASCQGRKVEQLGDMISDLVSRPRRVGLAGYNGSREVDNNSSYYGHYENYNYNNDNNNSNPNLNGRTTTIPPSQRTRRSSVSSTSSESSLTSIDSISTISDLSVTDLATVRAQLLSLDDHHDRDLYEAAVGLRRQIEVLQGCRRKARISRTDHCRWGWGCQQQQQQQQQRQSWGGRPDWGQWGFPEQQQQRSRVDKRIMKEEMKATKKAFRDTFRRARDEQRERRRNRRNRRRQERRSRSEQTGETVEERGETHELEQRLGRVGLDDSCRQPVLPSVELPVSSSLDVSTSTAHVNAKDTTTATTTTASEVDRRLV